MTDPIVQTRDSSGPDRNGLAATVLKLEEIDKNLYRGDHLWKPMGGRGVFGGQVVGQALVAAGHTKPKDVDVHVHSIHCYFVRAGQPDRPILYHVDRLRDGQSFSTRTVKAVQAGEAILTMQVSYHRHEQDALEHQYTMPQVPPPDALKNIPQLLGELLKRPDISEQLKLTINQRLADEVPIELKPVDPLIYFREASSLDAKQYYWVKAKGQIGDDQNLHRCVAAYLSDLTLLRTAVTVDKSFKLGMMVSLDHAMWFHTSFRTDQWMLYECESPRAVGNRALTLGRLWKQDGTLAVSVAQEGLIRSRQTSKL